MEALAARLGTLGHIAMGEAPIADTIDTIEEEGGRATALVVLGGPEDGRVLSPAPGAVIGRAGGSAQIELYRDTRLTDRKVSRAHLRWEGQGRLDALQRVHIRRARALEVAQASGPVTICAGDEISLSDGTRLVAISTRANDR